MAVPVNAEYVAPAGRGLPPRLMAPMDGRPAERAELARELLHWLILLRAWRRVLEAETDPGETRADRDELIAAGRRLAETVEAARSKGLLSGVEARVLIRADEQAKAAAEKMLARDAETEDAA